MTLIPIPEGRVARMLLALWLAAGVAALVYAFVARNLDNADVVFSYLILALSFPLGFLFSAFAGIVLLLLNELLGIAVPGGFALNLLTWTLCMAAGYAQWFLLVPQAWRRLHDT